MRADVLLMSTFFRRLGPSYETFWSSYFANRYLVPTKTGDGSETPAITFEEAIAAARRAEKLQNHSKRVR